MTQPAERWTPQIGPRDAHGRWLPVYRTERSERLRRKRIERDARLREETQDTRTRIGRRVRTLENDLRRQLRKQGQIVTIDADLTVGTIAQAQVRLEAWKARMSRDEPVDDDKVARLLNIVSRGLGKLNLRPDLLDGRERPPSNAFARERWAAQDKAAQTASGRSQRGRAMRPPDGRPQAE